MLNAVKCTIASVFFLALVPFRLHVWRAGLGLSSTNATTSSLNESISVQQTSLNLTSDASLSTNAEAHVQVARMDMLVLSAFLGIAIGDIVWLHALSVLGARKVRVAPLFFFLPPPQTKCLAYSSVCPCLSLSVDFGVWHPVDSTLSISFS